MFELDHLATRMRRNAESLLVLVGETSPRPWSAPLPVADVIRAALSEVEDYRRVVLRRVDEGWVAGAVVAEVAHMLAELVENGLAVLLARPGGRDLRPQDRQPLPAGRRRLRHRHAARGTGEGQGPAARRGELPGRPDPVPRPLRGRSSGQAAAASRWNSASRRSPASPPACCCPPNWSPTGPDSASRHRPAASARVRWPRRRRRTSQASQRPEHRTAAGDSGHCLGRARRQGTVASRSRRHPRRPSTQRIAPVSKPPAQQPAPQPAATRTGTSAVHRWPTEQELATQADSPAGPSRSPHWPTRHRTIPRGPASARATVQRVQRRHVPTSGRAQERTRNGLVKRQPRHRGTTASRPPVSPMPSRHSTDAPGEGPVAERGQQHAVRVPQWTPARRADRERQGPDRRRTRTVPCGTRGGAR